MANSCRPGPLNPAFGACALGPRSSGPLGFADQGDPNFTTLMGDTPGPLGFADWGQPAGGMFGRNFLFGGFMCFAADGVALAPSTGTVNTEMTWDDMKGDFEKWEAMIPHMYLDTRGNVTVGVGNLLGNAAAAKALPFVKRKGGKAATDDEIAAEFNTVAALEYGNYKATWYASKTTMDLPLDDAWALLKKRVYDEFIPALKDYFDHWDTFPVPVKRALLDMAFNLGMGRAKTSKLRATGLREFASLKTSVEAADWKKAAGQCHRGGIPDERNNWTRDLFLEADKAKK